MPYHQEVKDDTLTHKIIGLAINVHSELGPDLSEAVYRDALCLAIKEEGLAVEREKEVTILYKGRPIGRRVLDLLVDNELVLELKVAKRMTEEHFVQLGANVRAARKGRGLLLNFGASTVGIRRYANDRRMG